MARRFIRGAAWSVFGTLGSSGITLVMMMVVARWLGKDVYGQFVMIQTTLNMVGVFAGFGIGMTATRYTAELKSINPVRLGHILTLTERTIIFFGLAAAATLATTSDWLAIRTLNSPALGAELAIASIAVPFVALDGYQKSVLIGLERMRAFVLGALLGACAGFPVMLIATNVLGLRGAALGVVALAFIQASISRYQMARVLSEHAILRNAPGCLKERSILSRFAFPALISGALVGPVHWLVQAMLANTPDGYAELAVLGIAMQWFNLTLFIPGTIGRIVLPILTDYVASGNYKSSKQLLRYAVLVNGFVALPLVMLMVVASSDIIKLYGEGYGGHHVALILSVSTAAIVAMIGPIGNLLAAKSRMWLGSGMNAGWAAVYLLVTVVLVQKGASGVLLALLVAYIAHSTWVSLFALRYFNK